jgi:hypothetical protein
MRQDSRRSALTWLGVLLQDLKIQHEDRLQHGNLEFGNQSRQQNS